MRRVRVRPPQSRALKLLLPAALALLALALVPSSFGIVNLDDGTTDQISDFDARAAAAPTAGQLAAASSVQGTVSWTKFGTPAQVFHRGGYLATGLKAPGAAAAARTWLAMHKQAFGLNSVSHLRLMTAAALRGAPNFHAVSFRQAFGQQLSADGVVTVAVLKAKRSWKVLYASSSLTPDAPLTGKQKLSPLSAWLHAARAAGIRVKSGDASVLGETADGALAISALGVSGAETVKPIAFGTPRHGALRAYDTTVTRSLQGSQDSYRVIVDAATGKLLYRQNQVFNLADNPTWKGFQGAPPFNPMNAYPWNYPSTDTRDTFCWTATAGCTIVVGDATTTYGGGVASKVPWDVQLDVTGANLGTNADGGQQRRRRPRLEREPRRLRQPGAPPRVERDPRLPAGLDERLVQRRSCNPNNVNAAINPTGNDIEASTASMFVGHNLMHDFSYYLGFDEGHWNAQQYNNGVATVDPTPTPGGPTATPVGNDGLIGNAQSGAATGSRDNANMSTGADGQHPTTNQFVWQPLAGSFYAPCVDGAYDFSVYGHEFGHLIENRMIGKGVGARQGTARRLDGRGVRRLRRARGHRTRCTSRPSPAPTATPRAPTRPATATTASATSSRAGRWAASSRRPARIPTPIRSTTATSASTSSAPRCTPTARSGSRSRSTCATCSSQRYPVAAGTPTDIACVRGQQDTNACPGDRRWIQDYYDSMVIMPRGPTMIQARDAMLAADMGRFGGANQDLIWQGFAMRGFGKHQSTVSNADANPVPDFSSPLANNATVNFFADSKDGSAVPVNAKIFVGDYSARSTQIADTNPATVATGTNATGNLDNTAQFVPTAPGRARCAGKGTTGWAYYNFVAVAPGYGHVRFRVKRPAGRRGPEHHDPHADELRVGDAGRDGHDRRSRNRDERDPQQPDRRQRGRRATRRAARRPPPASCR